MNTDSGTDLVFRVVLNHEEQYSIWPADREIPRGWSDGQKTGTKSECLAHIESVWIDMRPLSLRNTMVQQESMPDPAL